MLSDYAAYAQARCPTHTPPELSSVNATRTAPSFVELGGWAGVYRDRVNEALELGEDAACLLLFLVGSKGYHRAHHRCYIPPASTDRVQGQREAIIDMACDRYSSHEEQNPLAETLQGRGVTQICCAAHAYGQRGRGPAKWTQQPTRPHPRLGWWAGRLPLLKSHRPAFVPTQPGPLLPI